MSNVNSVLFESYLKIKNSDFNDRKTDEKASIGYFILNIKEKTFLYKKNKESSNINARHTEKDILNFEETVDYDDKGLCDYPFGFQIITKQKTYILFSISRLIYTRWIDSLKLLFKTMKSVNYNKNITPETSPEKGKNNFVNPSFKQQEKSPISTKAKLSTNNNINNYNFNNEKLIGFDEEFLKAINDMDEHDIKKNYPKNLNLGNPNSFEKGLKSSMNNLNSNKNSHQYEEINSNEVFLISSNQSHGLKIQRAAEKQQKVAASSPYANELTRAVSAVASLSSANHPLTTASANPKRAAVLIITADRGMAGAYSNAAIKEGDQLIALLQSRGLEVNPYLVGRKGINFYKFRNRKIAASWSGFSDNPTYAHAKEVSDALINAFIADAQIDPNDNSKIPIKPIKIHESDDLYEEWLDE